VLLVPTDEVLSVQPATRIPAIRIDDAISIMSLLFCIGFVSCDVRLCTGICPEPALVLESPQFSGEYVAPGQACHGRILPEPAPARRDTSGESCRPHEHLSMISGEEIILHQHDRCLFYIQRIGRVKYSP
jgi:hypothetical protein